MEKYERTELEIFMFKTEDVMQASKPEYEEEIVG